MPRPRPGEESEEIGDGSAPPAWSGLAARSRPAGRRAHRRPRSRRGSRGGRPRLHDPTDRGAVRSTVRDTAGGVDQEGRQRRHERRRDGGARHQGRDRNRWGDADLHGDRCRRPDDHRRQRDRDRDRLLDRQGRHGLRPDRDVEQRRQRRQRDIHDLRRSGDEARLHDAAEWRECRRRLGDPAGRDRPGFSRPDGHQRCRQHDKRHARDHTRHGDGRRGAHLHGRPLEGGRERRRIVQRLPDRQGRDRLHAHRDRGRTEIGHECGLRDQWNDRHEARLHDAVRPGDSGRRVRHTAGGDDPGCRRVDRDDQHRDRHARARREPRWRHPQLHRWALEGGRERRGRLLGLRDQQRRSRLHAGRRLVRPHGCHERPLRRGRPAPPPARAGPTNAASHDQATAVTLSIKAGTGAPGAILTCTGGLTKTVVNGLATFAGCSIDRASPISPANPYQLLATATGLTSATSSPLTVGAPTILTVTPSATVITWGGTVVLTARFGSNGASRTVTLQGARDGVSWATIATLTTDVGGAASLAYRPATNLYYRAVFLGAPDLAAVTSPTTRVVVRQIALLRPTNSGAIKVIRRGTSITFVTTIRPARPELPTPQATFRLFRRGSGGGLLVGEGGGPANSGGQGGTGG